MENYLNYLCLLFLSGTRYTTGIDFLYFWIKKHGCDQDDSDKGSQQCFQSEMRKISYSQAPSYMELCIIYFFFFFEKNVYTR